jgi:hypothetical protein
MLAASTKLTYPEWQMVFPARSVWATTGAMSFLCACTIYSPDLLKSTEAAGGGSGAAGAGNPCSTGSKCADAGQGGASGRGGAAGAGGASGASGAGGGGVDSDAATVPYISSTTLNPSIGVGLSSEGTLDWAHWGLTKAADYNHKKLANQLQLISTLASVGTKPITLYTMDPTTFAWSDGTPTASGMSTNGVQVAGIGEGFVVTAPAGTPEVRLLRLYVGVIAGTAQITAKFSDPKASNTMLSDLLTRETNVWYPQVMTFEYQDSAPGTTISITWKVLSGADAGMMPAVHLAAVTLAPKQ